MGGPDDMTNDGPKFHAVPFSYDASEVDQVASEGRSLFAERLAQIEAAVAEMRERELDRAADDALAVMQSLGDAPYPMRLDRMYETTNADGEKVMFVMREPEMLVPMTIDWPKAGHAAFILDQRIGGVMMRSPIDRIVTVTTPSMPTAPGVDAMLADGWVWTGWDFARDQGPGRVGRWGATSTIRYAGRLDADRVLAGRYAERLPTNRKRKRARAKARRRARFGE